MSTPVWGLTSALAWTLLCLRWFDAGAPFRPALLASIPPLLLALPAALAGAVWLHRRWSILALPLTVTERRDRLLVVALAVLFRLPLAWQGSAAYVTPDGALSGIVALHARDGVEHLVFVPSVPYSGSLKSHLTAALAHVCDASRAFALVSVGFYALFVAAVFRLTALAVPGSAFAPRLAGLYLAFPPTFVTRYSLSNDGNYVEVLALGACVLVLAVRWVAGERRPSVASAIGLLLGLAFWCHILAAIHAVAVGLVFALSDLRRALRALPLLLLGFALGDLPGLLWNAGNQWESFRYVLPTGQRVGTLEQGPDLLHRAWAMVVDQWPVLLGYDMGYPRAIDAVLLAVAWAGVLLALVAMTLALRDAARVPALRVLLSFAALNVAIAAVALPHITGNPRYLLFLMTVVPVVLARALESGGRRVLLLPLLLLGALGSLAQGLGAVRGDGVWRGFVQSLEAAGVRHCYTDFHLATKINFLSEERVVCSSKLGPIETEYFQDYRRQTEQARDVALVAVNQQAAAKLERRLAALGVGYERRDLWKPVLLRLERKVEPAELRVLRAPGDTPPVPGGPAGAPPP